MNGFLIDTQMPSASEPAHLITATGRQSVVNRTHYPAQWGESLVRVPWAAVSNHLLFVSSQLGQPFYTEARDRIALQPLEPDPFHPGRTMAGGGRHFLFQVLQPAPEARVLLEMTTSLNQDGENRLPPAEIIGTRRLAFPIVGRGSARVYSPVITPQSVLGLWYIGIDMGTDGTAFPQQTVGLMNLYGKDVPTDSRRQVAFIRNISLVSAADMAALVAPTHLENFPADLADPGLEYSGLYEDGWISDAARARLTQPAGADALVLRGTVPESFGPGFRTALRVLVDDELVIEQQLRPGPFDLRAEIAPCDGTCRIEIRFSRLHKLSAQDQRRAAAVLEFLGFEAANGSQ
jgi:hypothetical protein